MTVGGMGFIPERLLMMSSSSIVVVVVVVVVIIYIWLTPELGINT